MLFALRNDNRKRKAFYNAENLNKLKKYLFISLTSLNLKKKKI